MNRNRSSRRIHASFLGNLLVAALFGTAVVWAVETNAVGRVIEKAIESFKKAAPGLGAGALSIGLPIVALVALFVLVK